MDSYFIHELLREYHNKAVIEKQNKYIENLESILKFNKVGFSKFDIITQDYLVRSVVSELIESNYIRTNIYTNIKPYTPSIYDILDGIKEMKISISKSTLDRWIRKNYGSVRNICDDMIEREDVS